jgi:alkyl sulfatase BDS1-like metallo-beta-lactamase superfamily hydrolase
MPHFIKYSTIYWEHAIALGAEAADLEKVQRAVVSDMRILMSEMARSFDPVAAARLRAVLQFDFPDKDLHFRFTIADGQCGMETAASDTCDLRVTVDSTVWAQVFMREINVRDALMSRKIVLQGDKSLFTRLDRFFPPPVA